MEFVFWFAAANCFSYYSYDVHGNVNSLLQLIRHDGNVLAKTVDYEYDLISGKVNKVYYQKTKSDQLIHAYSYDGDNRITEVKTSTDGVLYSKEATYQYYAHGPLARTSIGELNVETQNYAYTVQGWIKQMQAEAFGYALGYNEKDYTAIGTAAILATPIAIENNKSKSLYNGNIASMTSKTPVLGTTDFKQQYSYDQLNRITASNTPGAGNAYKTAYSYDANGNIKTLSRYDATSKFDELSYNYETKAAGYLKTTNKLRWVDDAAPVSVTSADIEDQNTDNYSYDAVGNLIKDKQEEIDTIEWTVSGKVRRVTRTSVSTKPNLEFEYDASGQRIVKKVIRKDGSIANTYYLRDASGNVMSVYEYNSVSDDIPQLSEQYLYGSSRLGVYTPVGAGSIISVQGTVLGNRGFGRKSYELSDHLGNVRATLSDYRRQGVQAIVNSATDYYPFGMVARTYASAEQYRYGFNGKETDDETGWQDYGMRMYNPALARFCSVDPITSKYPMLTPYQFASNTPIMAIDQDGLEAWVVIWASHSYGEDGTESMIGHAGIIVKNYVAVTKQVESMVLQKNGVMAKQTITITDYVHDGTYTYFDLWPENSNMDDPTLNEPAVYDASKYTFKSEAEMQTWMSTNDVTGSEHYAPDGMLKIGISPAQTVQLSEKYAALVKEGKLYNAGKNNCATFVCTGLTSVGINISPEWAVLTVAGLAKGQSPFQSFYTPNSLYKQLLQTTGVTVIKDAGSKVNEDYEAAVVDPAIRTEAYKHAGKAKQAIKEATKSE